MALLSTLLALGFLCVQQDEVIQLRDFLRENADFASPDLHALETGKVVIKFPRSADRREVAVFGAVLLDVPKEFFVEQFRDIETFRKSSAVPEVGRLSDPPSLDDLVDLSLPREDLESLRACQVGDCQVKLPATAIERFRREVDWASDSAGPRAADLARQMLLDYATAYMQGGNGALGEYNDKKEPLSIAEGFQSLRLESPYLMQYVPEFNAYIREYPNFELADTEDFMYWAREDFGLKPVVTLTHATIYTRRPPQGDQIYISLKQIYASHYYHAALGLIALIDDLREPDRPKSYMLFLNRARFDGELSGLARSMIRRRLERNMRANLKSIHDRLEESYRAETSE